MKFNIKVTLKTWLHIWSWNADIEIWGMDQPIIKDKDGYPYIPASSLKWKLRSLYEVYTFDKEELEKDKKNALKIFDWENYDEVSMFFLMSWDKWEKEILQNLWPTRFIFRDLKLSEKDKNEFEELKNKWEHFLEDKTEVVIDRKTWTSKQGWLRPLERVPAWIVFEWELIVRFFNRKEIIEQWNEKLGNWKITSEKDIMECCFWEDLKVLKEYIENDYLGWQWTRWSGAIEINFISNE